MDGPSFDSIVADHSAWIRRTLASLGVDARNLNDVRQEVLRGVASGLPTFDPSLAAEPEGALKGWLFGICERQAANYRRRKRRRAEVLREPQDFANVVSGAPNPEAALLACEQKCRLYEALETMEPKRAAVLIAYELEGIPMVDVAIQQGVSVNTAWNRLRLARRDIRAAFRHDEGEEPGGSARLSDDSPEAAE